ncbi:hypothetical protein L8106_01077 [Lyngbya sp. PCC 8106]|nr:hypothetical protein L8106_01077 [Lyngbya sp. PCC 8106]
MFDQLQENRHLNNKKIRIKNLTLCAGSPTPKTNVLGLGRGV